MVLSVFGDESADETKQRVFAVCGVFGTEEEWCAAESAWTSLTRGEVFHAADWEHQKRGEEYKALALALAGGRIGGVVYALDLIAFRNLYPDLLLDAAYYKCFLRVLKGIAGNVRAWNQRVAPNDVWTKVEYTFDSRRESDAHAGRLYGLFINDPEWQNSTLLADKISFQTRTNPRIQMADMIAREGMKDLDRLIGPSFPERKSKIALAESGHFLFESIGRQDLEEEREQFGRFESDGFTADAYNEWLHKTGRVQNGRPHDTWENRMRFQEWFYARNSL